MAEDIQKLAQWLRETTNAVFFGGAGVSTESQIPDFRSEQGLYKAEQTYGYPPETMLSHSFFESRPADFYRYYFNEMIYPSAKPNAAHLALAELESRGKLQAVITQNIDGLHQAAGSRRVLELHGSVLRNYCLNCGLKFDLNFMLNQKNGVPHCPDCGGLVRPEVVLYEEALDSHVMREAQRAIEQADMLIVGGTSLVVYPAAGLLQWFRGRHLVLINKSETGYDSRADLVIHDSIGKTLGEAIKII